MSVTSQKRYAWAGKLGRLKKTAARAEEALLLAIYEAHEEGVSYDDIAHMIGDKSGSGIAAKVAKGKALAEGAVRAASERGIKD